MIKIHCPISGRECPGAGDADRMIVGCGWYDTYRKQCSMICLRSVASSLSDLTETVQAIAKMLEHIQLPKHIEK